MRMTPDSIERYARHLVLKEIGGPGQQALLGAKVVLVGAGGLGGPAGLYLAAAGVGQITIIDDDQVEASNLQRQVQFVHTDVGMPKAVVMGDTLRDLNPDIRVTHHITRLTAGNAERLLAGHDVIIDGVDDFATRFAINAAALVLKTPLISGALGRFDGQVMGFASDGSGPCYRCFVPEIPPDAETCAAVGVVGALAGIIGSMMALEVIKLITGAGQPLLGRLYLYDGLSGEGRTVNLPRDSHCPQCGSR
ncbi:HesA/MoeB/ThiF family protein [Litorimonas sp. RW-G-Af-16]|uniref:HesA/MoeB/ThiF family protein n=1 Tax=Litorimonas sp. RW-G-Af-16 TaxID=3241168 RepID=UPI00390C832E